jgi:hypothetical protein
MLQVISRARAGGAAALILLTAAGAGAANASSALVEQRMVSQEGLAIALASTVLQSQLNILITAEIGGRRCDKLSGGTGSIKLISHKKIDHSTERAMVVVYFDRGCETPYVAADATLTESKSEVDISETADYTGPTGDVLGEMKIQEKALSQSGGGIKGVIGVGQFTPSNGAVPVDLGLECDLSDLNTQKKKYVAPCEGGIAQDFPDLSRSLASVTPLTLHLKQKGKNFTVSFDGKRSYMATGDLGALSITTPTDTSLGIGGTYKNYHNSAQTAGFASQFSLFPPTPTYWSITDAKNDAKFSISVIDEVTRNSSGTVTSVSTGDVLATFAVDQSGTGSITYSDGSIEPITSWLLAD